MQQSAIIQVLRGLAALALVVFHKSELLGEAQSGGIVVSHLFLGVDVFFIISGFVIALATRTPAPVSAFVTRRIFRIVPLAWTAIALLALVKPATLTEIVRGLAFLPEAYPVFPFNPPQWTLTYELCFYALFALAIGLSNRWRCEISVAIILAATTLAWLWRDSSDPLRFPRPELLLEFAAGVVLARLLMALPRELPRRAVAAIGTLAIAAGIGLIHIRPLDSGLGSFGGGAALVLAGLLVIERSWPLKIPRLLLQLGEISYAVYIVQIFAVFFVDSHFFWTPVSRTWLYTHSSGVSRLALYVTFVLLWGSLLHVLVEKPGIEIGRRIADRLSKRSRALRPERGGGTLGDGEGGLARQTIRDVPGR